MSLINYRTQSCPGVSQVTLVVKSLPANAGDIRDSGLIPESGRSPGEGCAAHSNIFVWRIPWREEPGRPQSIGSQRVGRDWCGLFITHAHRATQTTTTDMWQEWHYCVKSMKIWECLLLQQNLMDLERHVASCRVGEKNSVQVFNITSPRVAWGRKAQGTLILFTSNQHRFFSNSFVQSFILSWVQLFQPHGL